MAVSWRQFAAIPYGLDVDRTLRALDVTIPPEAPRPSSFRASGLFLTAVEGGFSLLDVAPDHQMEGPPGSRLLPDGSAVLKQVRWPAGTETGDALRRWLQLHGWVPRSERRVDAAQQGTGMVT